MLKSLIHHQRIRIEADVVVVDVITLHQDNLEFPEFTSNNQFHCVPCIYLSAKSVFKMHLDAFKGHINLNCLTLL